MRVSRAAPSSHSSSIDTTIDRNCINMSDINFSIEYNSDNETTTTHSTVYDASTEIDSPTSSSTTLLRNTSSELSELDHMICHDNLSSPVTSNAPATPSDCTEVGVAIDSDDEVPDTEHHISDGNSNVDVSEGNKPYGCTVCAQTFISRSNFLKHLCNNTTNN